MEKTNLFGKTLPELKEITALLSLPSYVASQLADWLYRKNVSSFEEMTNISKKNREILSENYSIEKISQVHSGTSRDGTKKYLFPVGGNYFVESVFIPGRKRATLCLSVQAGCKMNCSFCMTGKQGFQSNLTSGQILSQLFNLPEKDQITNIVYMGMGEPFDNTEEVLKSLQILTEDWGYGMSPKKITVSTIGIMPGMLTFIKQSKANLAISLHSPFHGERKKLIPAENKFPVREIIKILKDNPLEKSRRLSFEYIMFKDLNDSPAHAAGIAKLLEGLDAKVNLIRFHSIPGTLLQGSSSETMEKFRVALGRKGIMATVRASRGQDIEAACGLLSTRELLKRNRNN